MQADKPRAVQAVRAGQPRTAGDALRGQRIFKGGNAHVHAPRLSMARPLSISLVACTGFGFYRLGGPQAGETLGRKRMADELARDIIEKIKAHADTGGEEITTSTELTALGIHSLELTEIIFDLEEAYGIEIEMNTVDAWSNLKNVGDMVEAVRALIEKKKA
jgi:nodulation protein F